MKLDSTNSPVYLPDKEQTSVLRLGIKNYSVGDWIFPPNDLNVFLNHKRELDRLHGNECYAESQCSTGVQREFHDFLLERLVARKEMGYSIRDGQLIHEREKLTWEIGPKHLRQAALWVPEDFCLLEERKSEYVMTAASVHSPSNWILREKVGQSVEFIHEPVPGYDGVLSERVNRFLLGLKQDRVVLRYNWSIQDNNELFWRDDLDSDPGQVNSTRPGQYWRIERQTFLRLPESKAVVFGIRIFLHSFDSIRESDSFNHSLKQLLAQLPEDQKHYKGLAP
ncbi:MAG: hypothetical protein DHS20C12_19280 [Pseudohongiella sp.]|nr:MAG: hypothetical protein DHS20C12_19280 [Pseudohongiella sp.]